METMAKWAALVAPRKKPNVLQNVRVAYPCPAGWEQMAGDDRARHCVECNLNVYNLSAMTEREAEELIARREGRLCVRFYRRKDGTILTQDCPRGLRAAVDRLARVAGAALSLLMSIGIATAQTTLQREQRHDDKTQNRGTSSDGKETSVTVFVVDSSGAAVHNAIITIKGNQGEKGVLGITNSEGTAKFPELADGRYVVSVVRPGFELFRITTNVRSGKTLNLSVPLYPAEGMETLGVLTIESPSLMDNDPIANPTFTSDEINRLL